MPLRTTWVHHKWAIFYCAVSAIGALCYGYDNTYYNGVLAMQEFKDDYGDVRDATGRLALSSSFQSLTASAIYIGDLLGAMIAAPLNDRYGRKSTFWLASFCIFIGGICQVADIISSEALLVVGRILIGLGVGQFTVTSLLYIGEVAPLGIRGPALMCFQFLQSWSQLCASAINQGTKSIASSLGYRIPMGGLVILPLIMAALLPFIPESPLWYVLKGRRTEAEQSFRKINQSNPNYDPSEDMATAENAKNVEEEHAEFSSWGALITDPIERRKLIYSAGAMFSQQICGILFFYVYGVVFVQAIGLGDPFLVQLITNIVQIFAVSASIITVNKVRRRTNLMITNLMMLVAFIIIGGVAVKPLTSSTQYVIVVFSFVVVVGFNFGLGPLAYTVAREMAVGPNQNKIMSATIPAVILWVIIGGPITNYFVDRKGLRIFPSPGVAGISSSTHVRIGPNYVSISDPRAVYGICGHGANFLKDAWYDGGAGEFRHMSDKKIKTKHQRKRKLLAHVFAQRSLSEQEPVIAETIRTLISQLRKHAQDERPVNMRRYFNYFTIDAFSTMLFGSSLNCLKRNSDIVNAKTPGGNPVNLPFGKLLTECSVMMNAGTETTTAALTNAVYLIYTHPNVLEQLREELDPVIVQNTVPSYDAIG
ncbi:uncharacterized protein CCOS01_14678 [Colletotrichum costaricense]|uniref:Major facilitator superfamily (MFS) profile domain-containing protein n=1 Tax=Colletotrichum costaricense TaxID=1209916 RepID=A0AAI9YIU2_9PEZI|nr:uncharacterized protein CCOS01_14678 [Colletotrichum costaricense]KAK1512438.1 hypothetical protein CCOS01_14678 [Colletotrichum costaricense]